MAHKKKHNRVPPGNQSHTGPGASPSDSVKEVQKPADEGAPFKEQDPKRRLGNYGGEGEHPIHQPGGKNDANH